MQSFVKFFRNHLHIILPCLACLLAFIVVATWFPDNVWTVPIQSDDAPAHYYFIKTILDTGLSQIFALSPEGLFYPPLFHILAAALSGGSVMTGLAAAWVVSAGLVFPIGMMLLVRYFVKSFDQRLQIVALVATPILAVSFFAFPYLLLQAGPLLAYGFALTILPWAMTSSLYLLDKLCLAIEKKIKVRELVRPLLLFVLSTGCLALAHPRALITYCLTILPFVIGWVVRLGRVYKKQVIITVSSLLLALVLGVVAFVVVAWDQYGERLLNPEAWFKLHPPTQSIFDGIISSLTLGVFDHAWPAIVVAVAVLASLVFLVIKKHYAVTAAFVLSAAIYFATVSLSGAVANIITAPWYRDENRIIAMLVITFIPVVVLTVAELYKVFSRSLGKKLSIIAIVVIFTTIVGVYGVADGHRDSIHASVNDAANVVGDQNTKILTDEKIAAFDGMDDVIGPDDIVIGDPFSGAQYLYTYTGRKVYFSIINPRTDKMPEYALVEQSFANGDPAQISGTVCGINNSVGQKYFIDLGDPYKTDLDLYSQFDGLRSQPTIQKLVDAGVFEPVGEYPSGQARPFVLYRVKC
ncbi:hypothetical protein FACS189431_2680 [Alphaproteobacteria bacterium]|nr:hypothetical protein FACS189431_2680 [Alphaproteobacteria bacterium]